MASEDRRCVLANTLTPTLPDWQGRECVHFYISAVLMSSPCDTNAPSAMPCSAGSCTSGLARSRFIAELYLFSGRIIPSSMAEFCFFNVVAAHSKLQSKKFATSFYNYFSEPNFRLLIASNPWQSKVVVRHHHRTLVVMMSLLDTRDPSKTLVDTGVRVFCVSFLIKLLGCL